MSSYNSYPRRTYVLQLDSVLGYSLSYKDEEKYLSIHLDRRLTWTKHMS